MNKGVKRKLRNKVERNLRRILSKQLIEEHGVKEGIY